jgi:hypothetical protein
MTQACIQYIVTGNRIVIETNKKYNKLGGSPPNTMHLFGSNFCDNYRTSDSLPGTLFLGQLLTY